MGAQMVRALPRCLSHFVAWWHELASLMPAEPFSTMAPKRTGPEHTALRARVWEAHTRGLSYGAIAAQEKQGRSTVQMMIKAIKATGQIAASAPSGRKSKLSRRYAHSNCFSRL